MALDFLYHSNKLAGPPDLDEILRRLFGKKIKSDNNDLSKSSSIYSRNIGRKKPVPFKQLLFGLLFFLISIWVLLGIYIVQPAQKTAVLQFGKFSRIEGAGVHWHPRGFVQVIKKDVDVLNTVKLDKLMLTSEENIVHVSFSVQYRISDLECYLFATTNPELILKQSLESAVRQVVGGNKLEKILTVSRAQITLQVQSELEKLLKQYNTGILVNEVIMQPAKAPTEVKSAFDDVIKAREDRERLQNEAQGYANKVVPIAKGKAQRILDEARAYQEQVVLEAEGNVASFNQLLPVYQTNPNIVENQIYYQTMEIIFKNNRLYILDGDGTKNLFYGEKPIPFALSEKDKEVYSE